MKAFWWFEENLLAGLARPGFNKTHWFDLPYDEAVLMGWLGQFSSGTARKAAFHHHIDIYCPKIAKFYNLDKQESSQVTDLLKTEDGLSEVFEKLSERTQILGNYDITDDEVHFSFCKSRLSDEINFLKDRKMKTLVTLTEKHHSSEILGDHFDLHHFSIEDLTAPSSEQVLQMAELIKEAKKNREGLGVHCLAGIGRTSTMLIAAHIALGQDIDQLKATISEKNPSYKLTGSQAKFIESVSRRLNG